MSGSFCQDFFDKIYKRVFRFLSYRPRSKKEIESFLVKLKKQKFFSKLCFNKIKKEVFKKLEELDLIDDIKFAQWWVETRLRSRPRGKNFLKKELHSKGVEEKIISQVLSQISEKQLRETAATFILKKRKLYFNLPPLKQKQKLISLLLRRGFTYTLAEKLVDELVKKE